MKSPPKRNAAPARAALKDTASAIYEADRKAQQQFAREANRLSSLFLRTENSKHLDALQRHLEGALGWKGRTACLERVYAQTGRSKPAVLYELASVLEGKANARRPRGVMGGAR